MNVVLPAPFSPTSARLCPLGTNDVDVAQRPLVALAAVGRVAARILEADALEADSLLGAHDRHRPDRLGFGSSVGIAK